MTDTTITQEAHPETQDAAIDPSEYASAKAQVDALSAELERYKAKAHAEGLERKKQEQAARQASERAAKQSGDVEALERSWAEKLAARETELASEVANLKTVIFAKTVGAMLPLLMEKLGFDPAVMASPFISTVMDAMSLLIYFLFAHLLLGI